MSRYRFALKPRWILSHLFVLVMVLGMVRAGLWQPGLLLFALACLASTALIILSIALLLAPRFAPWRRAGRRSAGWVPSAARRFSKRRWPLSGSMAI